MKRRHFAKKVSVLAFGVTLLPTYVSCNTKQKISLDSLMGKDANVLKQFTIIGNDKFSYVNLNEDEFATEFKAKSAVIYLENQKIVGYTLSLKKNIFQELEKKYGQAEQEINNHFGKKWVWQIDSIVRSLTIVKTNSLFLYSYYLPKNNLIVF